MLPTKGFSLSRATPYLQARCNDGPSLTSTSSISLLYVTELFSGSFVTQRMAVFLGDITVEGLDGERPLQTGEVVIIVVVLLMWAAVIGLFCRQYDIIKDNDSNNNPKEKGKGPEQSPQGRPVGTTRQKKSPSINTIDV